MDWGGAGAPNISANGFPNCNRSSDAFEFCGGAGAENRSTILPEFVGDDKNGLFTAAFAPCGEPTFDCCFKNWPNIRNKNQILGEKM